MLANWACDYSDKELVDPKYNDGKLALAAILKRIAAYRPPDSPALTIAGEVHDAQAAGRNVSLHDAQGVIIPPPNDTDE